MIHNVVKKSAYFDSVTLMLISSRLSDIAGVEEAAVMMGTQHNIELMKSSGVLSDDVAASASENDLIIGIRAKDQSILDEALKTLDEQFNKKPKDSTGSRQRRVKSIQEATQSDDSLNFAVVSIPGRYAATEVSKLLDHNMHVLLFSDNITVEEEVQLKDKAIEKGLLMMGPDCGTAIVNGTALGFANVVRQGNIGLVAASGTGLQEVTVIVDKLGGGISQALGTGGRDLKSEIGGRMMTLALEALEHDPKTDVIGIISKPPSPDVMVKMLQTIKAFKKPVVACFLGGDEKVFQESNAIYAGNLEELAHRVVAVVNGQNDKQTFDIELTADVESHIQQARQSFKPEQKYVRGLYTGGTLAYESLLLLQEQLGKIYSNIAKKPEESLNNVEVSVQHSIVDMGDDYFTDGMPHPMIDPRLRSERIVKEAKDPETAVILLDCVLGYGSHGNPAKALVNAIEQAKLVQVNSQLVYVASVCGTEKDPQVLSQQVQLLQAAGVIVLDTNAQAARVAAQLLKRG